MFKQYKEAYLTTTFEASLLACFGNYIAFTVNEFVKILDKDSGISLYSESFPDTIKLNITENFLFVIQKTGTISKVTRINLSDFSTLVLDNLSAVIDSNYYNSFLFLLTQNNEILSVDETDLHYTAVVVQDAKCFDFFDGNVYYATTDKIIKKNLSTETILAEKTFESNPKQLIFKNGSVIVLDENAVYSFKDLSPSAEPMVIKKEYDFMVKGDKFLYCAKDKINLFDYNSFSFVQEIKLSNPVTDMCFFENFTEMVCILDNSSLVLLEDKLRKNIMPTAKYTIPKEKNFLRLVDSRYIISFKKLSNELDIFDDFNGELSYPFYCYYLIDNTTKKIPIQINGTNFISFELDRTETDSTNPFVGVVNEQFNKTKYKFDKISNLFKSVFDFLQGRNSRNSFFKKLFSISLPCDSFLEESFLLTKSDSAISFFSKDFAKKVLNKIQKRSNTDFVKKTLEEEFNELPFYGEINEDLVVVFHLEDYGGKDKFLEEFSKLLSIINTEFKQMDFKFFSFLKKPEANIINNDTLSLSFTDALSTETTIRIKVGDIDKIYSLPNGVSSITFNEIDPTLFPDIALPAGVYEFELESNFNNLCKSKKTKISVVV